MPHKIVLKVMLSPYEKAMVTAHAKACNLSVSSYARLALKGCTPQTRGDIDGMKRFLKAYGDQGRLGGLLKMLLTNDERLDDMGREFAHATIDSVLMDIRETQHLMKEVLRDMLAGPNRVKPVQTETESES